MQEFNCWYETYNLFTKSVHAFVSHSLGVYTVAIKRGSLYVAVTLNNRNPRSFSYGIAKIVEFGQYLTDYSPIYTVLPRWRQCSVMTVVCVRQVLWSRSDGVQQVLSVGSVVSQADRYRVDHPYPRDWNLEIREVRTDDAGTYKCLIGSSPPVTKIVQLVVEGSLFIYRTRTLCENKVFDVLNCLRIITVLLARVLINLLLFISYFLY